MKRGAQTALDEDERNLKYSNNSNQSPTFTPLLNHQVETVYQNATEVGLDLYKFAGAGNFHAVQKLIAKYKNDISYGYKGWALSAAAAGGHVAVVEYLLQHTANDIHPKQIEFAYDAAVNAHQDICAQRIAFSQQPLIRFR